MSSSENLTRQLSKTGSRAFIDINELKKEEANLYLQSLGKFQVGKSGTHIKEDCTPNLNSLSPKSSSPSKKMLPQNSSSKNLAHSLQKVKSVG